MRRQSKTLFLCMGWTVRQQQRRPHPRLDEQAPWVVGCLPIGPEDVGCVPDAAKRLVHVGMVTATTREPRSMWPVDPLFWDRDRRVRVSQEDGTSFFSLVEHVSLSPRRNRANQTTDSLDHSVLTDRSSPGCETTTTGWRSRLPPAMNNR
jgi:hypothetical protein